jgi:predicted Zn finger-like uncharacterized protein
MFKVVPDQLRVSEGWVRCGQCSEVFDANLHLQSSASAAGAIPMAPPPSVPNLLADEPVSAEMVTRVDIQIPDLDLAPTAVPAPAPAPKPVGVVPEPAVVEPFLEVNPHALYIDPLDAPDPVTRPEPVAPQEPHLEEVAPAQDAPPEEEAPATEPDDGDANFHHAFLKSNGAPDKPRRRWAGVVLVLVSGVLGLALLLQVAVRERDRIVAMAPAARGALEPLCALVGCTLEPLRQIESVVIDSSSFTKLRGDVYRLAFTLKNTGQWPLAVPALELALTDLQDQTVVRKVFLAPEFADQHGVLEPGAELPASLSVALKSSAGGSEKIAGYRLLSFYP